MENGNILIEELIEHYSISLDGFSRNLTDYIDETKLREEEGLMSVDLGLIGLALFLKHQDRMISFMNLSKSSTKTIKEAEEMLLKLGIKI